MIDKEVYNYVKKNTSSSDKYVTITSTWEGIDEYGRGLWNPRWLDSSDSLEFEGHMFPVPKEYKAILKKTYGDYMKLPPENQRIAHHYYKLYLR